MLTSNLATPCSISICSCSTLHRFIRNNIVYFDILVNDDLLMLFINSFTDLLIRIKRFGSILELFIEKVRIKLKKEIKSFIAFD